MSIPYIEYVAESERFPVSVATIETDGHSDVTWVTYEQFVCKLSKDLITPQNNLVHMALGIAGETGEIVDAIKKHAIYGKPLDSQNVIEELGDLEFYMAGLRQMLEVSRRETLRANITKLQARYKDGYSDAAAIARADKSVEAETETVHVPGQAINLSTEKPTPEPKFMRGDLVVDKNCPDIQLVVIWVSTSDNPPATNYYTCALLSDTTEIGFYQEAQLEKKTVMTTSSCWTKSYSNSTAPGQ
jgi:NTP pyrophosphatase (non-canonical NTP hydrolase)